MTHAKGGCQEEGGKNEARQGGASRGGGDE